MLIFTEQLNNPTKISAVFYFLLVSEKATCCWLKLPANGPKIDNSYILTIVALKMGALDICGICEYIMCCLMWNEQNAGTKD